MKKNIVVDFDGVIHDYLAGWKGPDVITGKEVEGAIEWLSKVVQDDRFSLHIYSSRSKYPQGITAMKDWLKREGMSEEILDKINFPKEKPAAWVTIDDRCMLFEGEFPTLEDVNNFSPWYKKEGQS